MPTPDFVLRLRSRVGNELMMLPGASALVTDDEHRVLLMRRADTGEWSFPAGIVEPGEQPAQTVVREVFEETGLIVVPEYVAGIVGLVGVTYPNGDVSEYVSTVFRCRAVGGTLEPRDGEALEVGFHDLSSVIVRRAAQRWSIPLEELLDGSASFAWNDEWLEALHADA
ncbi:MAG: NUDIX domain-containing protein [Acidimicrobiia bacterium]